VEARFLMLATNNILKLSDGRPVVSPTQDMVIGSYYLTIEKPGAKGEGKYFKDFEEAQTAYYHGAIELQSKINVRITKEIDGKPVSKKISTTIGRLIFNEAIPQDLGFQKRETQDDMFQPEINFLVGKKELSRIVEAVFKKNGSTGTAVVLDKIKALGFKYSTVGAVTTSVFDMHIPAKKKPLLEEAEKEIIEIEKKYKRGFMTQAEKYKRTVAVWNRTTDEVTDHLMKGLDEFNPIYMMANSGARGNKNQIRQLAGMRGLMTNPNGKIIETPVRSSFREGLTVLEYFISSHGGRKGLADNALKTAVSGYLTRRLVDVSQDVIIREEDCFLEHGESVKGTLTSAITDGKQIIESLDDRIAGRYAVDDVVHPETCEILVPAGEMISTDAAKGIVAAGIKEVNIRTALTCKSRVGLCAKCYGKNMAGSDKVRIGEAVGIIAAQSIGEPGTQLTMRTFHTGGVASADDITQGLPRVEELFEARKPKGVAILTEFAGRLRIEEKDNKRDIIVKTTDGDEKVYSIPYGAKIKAELKTGDAVLPGDPLTEGSINPHDILKTKGLKGVQEYLLKEVQYVYRMQGVEINDKHVEVIVRQMLRKVRIEDSGTTALLQGDLADMFTFEEENRKALESGGVPASAKRTLLGITKAALATDSWLSAASFQETARVLTEAAIKNKVDQLIGLKENVIIGKLIPAGTGMKKYKSVTFKEAIE
jgi:DNA-directed RNA polymerase subunit beta'